MDFLPERNAGIFSNHTLNCLHGFPSQLFDVCRGHFHQLRFGSCEIFWTLLIPPCHRSQSRLTRLGRVDYRLGRRRDVSQKFTADRVQIAFLVCVHDQLSAHHKYAFMLLLKMDGHTSILGMIFPHLGQFAFGILQAKFRSEAFGKRQGWVLWTEEVPSALEADTACPFSGPMKLTLPLWALTCR